MGSPAESDLAKSIGHRTGKVEIQKGAWICIGATILPGATIGVDSMIAAGAVVTGDVPTRTLYGGVPAKMIRNLNEIK
ncbi:hypothetical protein N9M41_05945 [Rhodopirellula sp.]|nr:hypothetical protein [Rhodopirellula sp.]